MSSRIVESLYRVSNLDESILNEGGGYDLHFVIKLLASNYDVKYSTQRIMNMGISFEPRRFPLVINGIKATIVEKPEFTTEKRAGSSWPVKVLHGRSYYLVINRRASKPVFWPVDEDAEFPKDEFLDNVDELLSSF